MKHAAEFVYIELLPYLGLTSRKQYAIMLLLYFDKAIKAENNMIMERKILT